MPLRRVDRDQEEVADMSILTGLAAETYADFKDDFEDGTLSVPGSKTPNGQGGWIDGDPVPHACKVLITNPSDYRRVALGIPATDRVALVLSGSLSVIPEKGQKITAPDPLKGMAMTAFDIIEVGSDPAGALFKLQVR